VADAVRPCTAWTAPRAPREIAAPFTGETFRWFTNEAVMVQRHRGRYPHLIQIGGVERGGQETGSRVTKVVGGPVARGFRQYGGRRSAPERQHAWRRRVRERPSGAADAIAESRALI